MKGPPMRLPDSATPSHTKCPEDVEGQRLLVDFISSELQLEPSLPPLENNTVGMNQELHHSSKRAALLHDDDNQQESPVCHENKGLATFRLFEEDESPSDINADHIVPDPHLLFPSSQQEKEQQQQTRLSFDNRSIMISSKV